MTPDDLLKLRAEDSVDLAVISACAQDALVSVKDLTYDRAAHRFTAVINRFRWEGKQGGAGGERTHAAIMFDQVESVSYRGFRRSGDERILSLLAIRTGGTAGTIDLEFAGGATVRLKADAIRVRLADIGEPWPTAWQPDHESDDQEKGETP